MDYWIESKHQQDVNPWKYKVLMFFADSAGFYPRHLTNGNFKAYYLYHFLKDLNKIFQVLLSILPKMWLFGCHQQKIQKMSHVSHFNDHNWGTKHDIYANDPVFLIYSLSSLYLLVYFIFAFQDLQN